MIQEVVWTQGAAEDYLRCDSHLASAEAVDALLARLMTFPELGRKLPRDTKRDSRRELTRP